MRAPWKRAAVLALATCGFSSLIFIDGCKTDLEKSDAAVSADLDKATEALSKDTPESATTAMQTLQKTTSVKNDSPESQIESNLLLAQAEIDAADQIMNGSVGEPGVIQRQVNVANLVSQMATLGAQIDSQNVYVAGYKALEPAAGHKAIEKATNDAQKGENGAWIAGTAPLPSLDALKQKQQELQKQIDDLNGQKKDLESKRTQALDQAGKFGQQADSTTGKQSVGFFIQSANQRKDAADAEAKIQQIDGQIAPLQQDLNLCQTQEKALSEVIAGYGQTSQQLDDSFKSVQQRIDEATALSKALIEGGGAADASAAAPPPAPAGAAPTTSPSPVATPRNLAALASNLDKQVKEAQALRAKAVELLGSASKHIEAARGIANTFSTSILNRSKTPDAAKLPERHAWQTLLAIYSPPTFDLRQASVQSRLARLYADQYAGLSERNGLASVLDPVLKRSGITVPPSLTAALPTPGQLPTDVDSALKGVEGDLKSDQPPFDKDTVALVELANAQTAPAAQQAIAATQTHLAFRWTTNLLNNVATNAGQGDYATLLGNVAHASLMANDYASSKFAVFEGKQQEGDALLKAALAERQTLMDNSARNLLPNVLPAELAFPIQAVVPTTAPAAPTGAPATTEPSTVFPGSQQNTPPASAPATTPAEGATPPATAPTPAPGTIPPAEGTTPPAPAPGTTPPAPAPGTTPPAEGTTPPAPAPGTTPAPAPAPGTTPPEGTTPPPSTPPAGGATTPPGAPPAQ